MSKEHESPRDDAELLRELDGIGHWTLHQQTTTLCSRAATRIRELLELVKAKAGAA